MGQHQRHPVARAMPRLHMTDSKLSSEILLELGFVDIGCWQVSGEIIAYNLDGNETTSNVLLDAPNALYAIVRGAAAPKCQ